MTHNLTDLTIKGLKTAAVAVLAAQESPLLEVDMLLASVLGVERTYLHTWPERAVSAQQAAQFWQLVERRQHGEPMAYILGRKAFWTFELEVTPATLIPRPETELLVSSVLATLPASAALSVADLGTGSGAIALALALERPHWQLTATDISTAALAVAKANAVRLKVQNVTFLAGAWCQALPARKFSAIVSNPPYLALDDSHLQQGDLRFEPPSALASGAQGLTAIYTIIQEARAYLTAPGWLFIEHGYQQGPAVREILADFGYTKINMQYDDQGHERIAIGCFS